MPDCPSDDGSTGALTFRLVRDLIGIFGFMDLHFLLDMCDENVPECENRLPQLGQPNADEIKNEKINSR